MDHYDNVFFLESVVISCISIFLWKLHKFIIIMKVFIVGANEDICGNVLDNY